MYLAIFCTQVSLFSPGAFYFWYNSPYGEVCISGLNLRLPFMREKGEQNANKMSSTMQLDPIYTCIMNGWLKGILHHLMIFTHGPFKIYMFYLQCSSMDARCPLSESQCIMLSKPFSNLTFSKALDINKMVQKPIIKAPLDIRTE